MGKFAAISFTLVLLLAATVPAGAESYDNYQSVQVNNKFCMLIPSAWNTHEFITSQTNGRWDWAATHKDNTGNTFYVTVSFKPHIIYNQKNIDEYYNDRLSFIYDFGANTNGSSVSWGVEVNKLKGLKLVNTEGKEQLTYFMFPMAGNSFIITFGCPYIYGNNFDKIIDSMMYSLLLLDSSSIAILINNYKPNKPGNIFKRFNHAQLQIIAKLLVDETKDINDYYQQKRLNLLSYIIDRLEWLPDNYFAGNIKGTITEVVTYQKPSVFESSYKLQTENGDDAYFWTMPTTIFSEKINPESMPNVQVIVYYEHIEHYRSVPMCRAVKIVPLNSASPSPQRQAPGRPAVTETPTPLDNTNERLEDHKIREQIIKDLLS